MKRTLVAELTSKSGEVVKVQGWVYRIRKLGAIAFLLIRDRTGIVQCVVDSKNFDFNNLKLETVIQVVGKVVRVRKVELGVEINVFELKVISEVTHDLPFTLNHENLAANLDLMLNHRVLSLRHPKTNAVFKIQAILAQSFGEFLKKEGFTQVFTPKIVAQGAEGGSELFELRYFDKKAYLAQSPQFYKQMLVGAGYERVFEIGHVYRAEEHATSRHLNEYISLDLEMGFISDERDLMELETKLLAEVFSTLRTNCKEELVLLEVNLPEIGDQIPDLKMSEAIQILQDQYGRTDLEFDLDPEGERMLGEYIWQKYGSEFVFITHYPKAKRPMYTMPADHGETHSFDLLFRGLEVTTGGQRIHCYEQLCASIAKRGLLVDNYLDYLEIFKYGMPPHGGLAIGLERLTGQLLGLKNIRQATLFPRDRYRLRP